MTSIFSPFQQYVEPPRRFQFIRAAMSDTNVAAISNSSKYVIQSVMAHLPASLGRVLEYGPGDGVATRAVLERTHSDGQLIAVETNPSFVSALRMIFDPRLTVLQGNVCDLASLFPASEHGTMDAIISSIPFSFLTPAERTQVVQQTYDLLAPGGVFVVFHQYSRMMRRPLEARFGAVSTRFEVRNVFPCFVLCARKK